MKRIFFPIVLILFLFVTFFSCSNKSSKRPRKPVSSISIQPVKQQYVCGEKVSLKVKTKLRDGALKSVQVYFGNQLIKESTELEFTINNVELTQVGNINFTIKAEKTDGLKNSRSKKVNIVSDIKPQIVFYQVIHNHPHLKTSYTQGLELYNGYLYEGTGEYGHSRLMKIDIKSGKPVQSIDMDKKYFGEGITILNNKIYQLTYKAQKGFVYNVNSFAVVDSFRFHSQEGWGLTNDGKYLIMSDGTNALTWIDPNNFSIVKKIQVASNRGNMNYLNELEYVDGMIYANIYTTNYIVKIDPSTGKVLEEINLKGMIDMYHKQSDRIDVLNGIAYDKKDKKFFITGKLWPKMFEIQFVDKN